MAKVMNLNYEWTEYDCTRRSATGGLDIFPVIWDSITSKISCTEAVSMLSSESHWKKKT